MRNRKSLGLLAGLLLCAAPARAAVECASVLAASEATAQYFFDALEDEFGTGLGDEKLCKKLAKNFLKTCERAVKDALACRQAAEVKGLVKQNTLVCKELAKNPSGCVDEFKEEGELDEEELKDEADNQLGFCSEYAELYFDTCM
jgi:hypothetical protein